MPNKAIDADVICPFYRAENDLSIKCEGVIDGTVVLSKFKNRFLLERYERLFCTTYDYRRCALGRCLTDKYEKLS